MHEVSDRSLVVDRVDQFFYCVFLLSLLPTVWKEMRMGQYYKALNMSRFHGSSFGFCSSRVPARECNACVLRIESNRRIQENDGR